MILNKLMKHCVYRHLDFFEMVRNEDEKELARKYEKVFIFQNQVNNLLFLLQY